MEILNIIMKLSALVFFTTIVFAMIKGDGPEVSQKTKTIGGGLILLSLISWAISAGSMLLIG